MIQSIIPEQIYQSTLDEWEHIETKIQQSKIPRIPYKKIIGKSLTEFITECRAEGLSSHQTMAKFMGLDEVKIFKMKNPHQIERLFKNIKTSVCARFSEQKASIRRLKSGN